MKCTLCGNEIASNLTSCPYCGTQVMPQYTQPTPQAYNPTATPTYASTPASVPTPTPSTPNQQYSQYMPNQSATPNQSYNQGVANNQSYTPNAVPNQQQYGQNPTPNQQYSQYMPNQNIASNQQYTQNAAQNQQYSQYTPNQQYSANQYSAGQVPQGQGFAQQNASASNPALVAFSHVPAAFWLGFIDGTPRGKKAASQGLWLLILAIGGGVVFAILSALLAFIKLAWLGSILSWGLSIAIMVFSIIGIVKGFQGEDYEIPLVGHIQFFK